MKAATRQPLRYRAAKVWLMARHALRSMEKESRQSKFRVLLFHHILSEQMPAFERLLRYLRNEHDIITPGEAEAILSGKPQRAPNGRVPYLLTFDDGFLSHARIAKDFLDPYGVKGIFFVCPGLIDTPRERDRETIARYIWDGAVARDDLPEDMVLMPWSDVETLNSSGHTIGAHGLTHRRLATLSEDEQKKEIVEARTRLEERLETPVKWFAYPFGNLPSIDQQSLDTVSSNYRFCCSGIRGTNSAQSRHLALLREQLTLEGPFEYHQLVLEGGLDFYHSGRAKRLQGLADQAGLQTAARDIQA